MFEETSMWESKQRGFARLLCPPQTILGIPRLYSGKHMKQKHERTVSHMSGAPLS